MNKKNQNMTLHNQDFILSYIKSNYIRIQREFVNYLLNKTDKCNYDYKGRVKSISDSLSLDLSKKLIYSSDSVLESFEKNLLNEQTPIFLNASETEYLKREYEDGSVFYSNLNFDIIHPMFYMGSAFYDKHALSYKHMTFFYIKGNEYVFPSRNMMLDTLIRNIIQYEDFTGDRIDYEKVIYYFRDFLDRREHDKWLEYLKDLLLDGEDYSYITKILYNLYFIFDFKEKKFRYYVP